MNPRIRIAAGPGARQAPRMQTWDHKQLDVPENEMEQVLHSFGQNGWELVSVIDETIDPNRTVERRMYRLFFKRAAGEGESRED